MPSQSEIEVPLLKCLVSMGGKGTPKEIYPKLAKEFPLLTDADLAEKMTTGGNKWKNRIRWVRQALIKKGQFTSPEYGVWAITEKGNERFAKRGPQTVESQHNLEVLAEDYFEAFKEKMIQSLQDLRPPQFERFAGALLDAYGFTNIVVAKKHPDGGIDGHGTLKVGLATIRVAFQCKRFTEANAQRPKIDEFRGAIQGEFQQGVFFTTSDFSEGAKKVSLKAGTVPIVLLNGEEIVKLMIEQGLGVRTRALEIYEDQIESLFEEEVSGNGSE